MHKLSLFENLVYSATKKIPKGHVSTYATLARHIGRPKAYRAVGNALNKNPFAPQVPCHRVVKSDGSLGGFASGSKQKKAILEKEALLIVNGKVLNFKDVFYDFKS